MKLTNGQRFLALACIAFLISAVALADKPDKPDGTPRIGDRVVFITDNDGDGFFERSPAIVTDDVTTVGRIHGFDPGQQVVNLYVFESEDAARARGSLQPEAFYSLGCARGREHGRYEALTTSNH